MVCYLKPLALRILSGKAGLATAVKPDGAVPASFRVMQGEVPVPRFIRFTLESPPGTLHFRFVKGINSSGLKRGPAAENHSARRIVKHVRQPPFRAPDRRCLWLAPGDSRVEGEVFRNCSHKYSVGLVMAIKTAAFLPLYRALCLRGGAGVATVTIITVINRLRHHVVTVALYTYTPITDNVQFRVSIPGGNRRMAGGARFVPGGDGRCDGWICALVAGQTGDGPVVGVKPAFPGVFPR